MNNLAMIDTGGFPQDEQQILTPIWQASEPFRAFYTAERPSITRPVYWSRLILGETMARAVTRVAIADDGTQTWLDTIIYLPNIPPMPSEAHLVAHELAHLLMHAQGYPGVYAEGDKLGLTGAVSYLNSLLGDAAVERLLHRYGFDASDGVAHDPGAWWLALVAARPQEPDRYLDCFCWACELVLHQLCYREGGGDPAAFDGVIADYCDRFPRVGNLSKRLLKLIDAIGYATPEQHRRIFTAILRRFNLPGNLRIA